MKTLVAAFPSAAAAADGARQAQGEGFPVLDALTPFPLPELAGPVGTARPRLHVPMAIAGFGLAAAAFVLESWSAAWAYPFNEGGRPLFSWPVFLLVPFEVGILAAGFLGFVLFLRRCGFPRLNHPYFDIPGVERASQDRFFLVLDPLDGGRAPALQRLLFSAGALAVSEAET